MKNSMQKVCAKSVFYEKYYAKSAPSAHFAYSCALMKKCA